MKKTLSLLAVAGFLILVGAGCNYQVDIKDQNTNQPAVGQEQNTDQQTAAVVQKQDEKTTPATETANDVKIEKDDNKVSPNSSDQNLTYSNNQYGYSVSFPAGWNYKETGGTYFSQAVGFNPSGTSNEDYKVIVAVLSVDRQVYLNSLDNNSNLKIDREFGDYAVNGLPASKFVYKNLTTGDTFSIFTITASGKTYVITPDKAVESVFLNSFKLN